MSLIFSLAVVASTAISGIHVNSAQKGSGQDAPTVCKLQGIFEGQIQQNAYTYFVPKGWTAQGNLTWEPRQPGSFHVKVSANTPDEQYEVTQTGQESYVWKVNYPFDGGAPLLMNTAVHHASEMLRVIFNKLANDRSYTDIEAVDEVNNPFPPSRVPEWQKHTSNVLFTDVPVNETGFLQLKFNRDGHPMIAMMGTTISGTVGHPNQPIGHPAGPSEGGIFAVGPTTLLIMPADASKQKQHEEQIVAGSIQMTPKFREYLAELTDRMIRIKLGAVAAGRRYADATFHERTMSQFNQQMHMKDAYSHAFCNYVSDLQDFKDPSGHIVTAPANYKYAWTDGKGNYLLNNNPSVIQNGVGYGDWKQMQKANIGD